VLATAVRLSGRCDGSANPPVRYNVGMRTNATGRIRIGELAAELDINPKTIRYYESIGLLPKPERTESGYRLYRSDDQERLAFILKARAVGLTLAEIHEMVALRGRGTQPCGHLRDLIRNKLGTVDDQLRALEAFRHELVMLEAEASETICGDGHVCGVIEHHHVVHDLTEISRPGLARSPAR